MSAETCPEQLRLRKEQMVECGLAAPTEKDYRGVSAILHLIRGKSVEQANEKLRMVAEWFIPPYKNNGRDPKGECDFAAIKLVRVMYMLEDRLEPETVQKIKAFFTENDFESKYKSENHMLIFHISRYLIGQKLPRTYFPVYGKSGAELMREDEVFLTEYLQFRAGRGWAEFDSCGYIAEDIDALLTLFDFSQGKLHTLAEMSLNLLLLDMISDCAGALYCGAHGRIYEGSALSHEKSNMFWVYHLYFGHQYEEHLKEHILLEPSVSDFCPAPYVYEVLEQKPSVYENFESTHLHCISVEIPQKRVPQVEGSISKYTYITPDYAIGAVNFQDSYPAESEAGWYAHHQQHEWDLTLTGGTDIKVFTHHPGSFGTEGAEHGYWTGDLGCCCGQFYCEKNTLLAAYDIPEREMQWIHAHVPLKYFERKEEDNYLFLKRDRVYVSLWFSCGYSIVQDGKYAGYEVRSEGGKHGVVCIVGTQKEYGDFEKFIQCVKHETVQFDASNMTLSCRGLFLSKTERRSGGQIVQFPYPTFSSPFMHEASGSGIVTVETASAQIVLDFNKITTTIQNK